MTQERQDNSTPNQQKQIREWAEENGVDIVREFADPDEAIVPFHRRRYEKIPIAQVKVINSRNRDKEQFDMTVQSTDHVRLLKPIRVNDKFLERTGMYELICGEGRLLAHQKLGRDRIMAEVITCTRKEAYLQSLMESIARSKPDAVEYARELKRMHDEGWDYKQIARVADRDEQYIREYIRLVE